jgi:hypothetical protein
MEFIEDLKDEKKDELLEIIDHTNASEASVPTMPNIYDETAKLRRNISQLNYVKRPQYSELVRRYLKKCAVYIKKIPIY